ncbi:DVUA0089 family protein [Sphingomonas sp. KRR8]|uniref:DVUA0089 family protein n=1 Tax=Sphingomonas sp. KRR8 TaxID=2942996 RepID=UPI002021AE18|nr:DVUA0089 family protein [Sphingomonas sp. KRR8]URD62152.1 DVUA0089 family protein [Sphingomonas sp. KRR8]
MSKSLLRVALGASALALFSTPAMAADQSFTGTLSDPNQVLLFNFTVGSPSNVTLRTWSYAGGVNAAGATIARGGFDPILALFDSTGAIINQNDDGGSNVAADAVTGQRYDTFLTALLNPGTYTVSVMAFSNFATGPNLSNGFSGGGSFTDVTGNRRTNAWAFDVLNVASVTQVGGAVPEPGTWALMLIGFGAVGWSMRHRRTAKAVQRLA